jgi:GT2 family glycosyltransferase
VAVQPSDDPPRTDVSVVIPTIGRPEQLRITLASLAACRPGPSEILVVDQSDGGAVAGTVADFGAAGAIHVASSAKGIGLAVNEGLRRARHEVVLGTHDDCSVPEDWIAVGCHLAVEHPGCIITGRVLPLGDPEVVPSIKTDPHPHDFTGEIKCDVLYPANMVVPRSRVLAFGGFDERFETAAEDNDLCYRWLRATRCLRYEPDLVVWHREWRTPAELRGVYVRYRLEQGRFYAKHLRAGDKTILRFLWPDLVGALRSAASVVIKRRPPTPFVEPCRLLLALLAGLLSGWRDFRERGPADL